MYFILAMLSLVILAVVMNRALQYNNTKSKQEQFIKNNQIVKNLAKNKQKTNSCLDTNNNVYISNPRFDPNIIGSDFYHWYHNN